MSEAEGPRKARRKRDKRYEGGDEARRRAAVVLEVLAGLRGPTEAATELGLAQQSYYQLETKALEGLVAALEPQPRGRKVDPSKDLARLEDEKAKLEREVGRLQALLRSSQRALGLKAPKAPEKGRKPKRRGPARGLRAARALRGPKEGEA